ncbi:MAG: hypothetical protein ACYTF1_16340 [Planctomycetota bacterium]|jgi:hypothetical protein
MSRNKAWFLVVAALVTIAGCSAVRYRSTCPNSAVMDHDRPSLGYLDHRGRQYEIRDLMNPAYRAASDDEFVRKFNIKTTLADFWADK